MSKWDDLLKIFQNDQISDACKLTHWINFISARHLNETSGMCLNPNKLDPCAILSPKHTMSWIFEELIFEQVSALKNTEFILTRLDDCVYTGEKLYTFIDQRKWILLIIQFAKHKENQGNKLIWKTLVKKYNVTVFDPSIHMVFKTNYATQSHGGIIQAWHEYDGPYNYEKHYLDSIYMAPRYDDTFTILPTPNWTEYLSENTRFKFRGAGFFSSEPQVDYIQLVENMYKEHSRNYTYTVYPGRLLF